MDGFTLVLCRADGCVGHPRAERGPVEHALSATTRRCPQGVLVLAGCLLGPLLCAACSRSGGQSGTGSGAGSGAGPGRLALVQPCHPSRRPNGPVVLVGPLRDPADTDALCRWLRAGRLTADRLPERLRRADRAADRWAEARRGATRN